MSQHEYITPAAMIFDEITLKGLYTRQSVELQLFEERFVFCDDNHERRRTTLYKPQSSRLKKLRRDLKTGIIA